MNETRRKQKEVNDCHEYLLFNLPIHSMLQKFSKKELNIYFIYLYFHFFFLLIPSHIHFKYYYYSFSFQFEQLTMKYLV